MIIMTSEEEMQAIYDRRKSFYKKAYIITDKLGRTFLRSYNTYVAMIENGKAEIFGTYSNTTLRHIKEFLLQHGFETGSKAELIEMYMKEEAI